MSSLLKLLHLLKQTQDDIYYKKERLREGKGTFIIPVFADEISNFSKDEFFKVIQWMVCLTCIVIQTHHITQGLQIDVVYLC
jgi:hypothetical protein